MKYLNNFLFFLCAALSLSVFVAKKTATKARRQEDAQRRIFPQIGANQVTQMAQKISAKICCSKSAPICGKPNKTNYLYINLCIFNPSINNP